MRAWLGSLQLPKLTATAGLLIANVDEVGGRMAERMAAVVADQMFRKRAIGNALQFRACKPSFLHFFATLRTLCPRQHSHPITLLRA